MIMQTGLVSVIIPVYNRTNLISETINSVLDQTYSNIELIIIDDGSEDNLEEHLEKLIKEKKITYFFQENSGLSSARNKGIQLARGEYINFLDSDDTLFPEKIEKQVEILKMCQHISVVNCNFNKFDNFFNSLGDRDSSFFHGKIYPEILWYWSMLIATACLLIRRNSMKKVGDFDVNLDIAEDLDMWVRLSKEHEFFHIPETLVKIRVHQDSMSNKVDDIANKFKIQLELAFRRDINLTAKVKSKSIFNMYKYSGLNYLGKSEQKRVAQARDYLKIALQYKPFDLLTIMGYSISFLPKMMRNLLFKFWQRYRYKAKLF